MNDRQFPKWLRFERWFFALSIVYIGLAVAGLGWDVCIDVCTRPFKYGFPPLNMLGLFVPVGPYALFAFTIVFVGVFSSGSLESFTYLGKFAIVAFLIVLALTFGERLSSRFAKTPLGKAVCNLGLMFLLTIAVHFVLTGTWFAMILLTSSLGLGTTGLPHW